MHRSSEIRQQSPLGEAFANADCTELTSLAMWLHGLWDDIETRGKTPGVSTRHSGFSM